MSSFEGRERRSQHLTPVTRARVYEEVVRRLRDYVSEGGLERGDRLPPERELAERLGVSRVSIRQALVALEVNGWVEVRHGDGTYLRWPAALGGSMHKLLEKRRRLPEVLEAREALETKLAELAAERRTDDDLRAINDALDDMAADIKGGGIGADADAAFHHAIVVAARNAVLARLMESIADLIHETRMESLSEPGRPPRSLAAHHKIANAIRAGEPRKSAAAMRRHLRVVADTTLLHWISEEESEG
jgi:GntR family transcriptional regulator, transcriptional repressor for pyruvate dehydrogenase complex